MSERFSQKSKFARLLGIFEIWSDIENPNFADKFFKLILIEYSDSTQFYSPKPKNST